MLASCHGPLSESLYGEYWNYYRRARSMSKILYIEDDENSRRLVQRVLEGAGHEVYLAPDGLSGIEVAQREADEIRKKARDDAKQLVIDGRKNLQERLHQEITQIEEEAAVRKKAIFQEAETRLAEMEQEAEKQMSRAVDRVISIILNQ